MTKKLTINVEDAKAHPEILERFDALRFTPESCIGITGRRALDGRLVEYTFTMNAVARAMWSGVEAIAGSGCAEMQYVLTIARLAPAITRVMLAVAASIDEIGRGMALDETCVMQMFMLSGAAQAAVQVHALKGCGYNAQGREHELVPFISAGAVAAMQALLVIDHMADEASGDGADSAAIAEAMRVLRAGKAGQA